MPAERRVLVIPGRSMGPFAPQLLFPAFAALRRGAELTPIEWAETKTVDELDASGIASWVADQTASAIDALDPKSGVIVGKSLGTYAAAVVADRSLPAIWVTPLLTNEFVRHALSRSAAPFLLVGGTADPFWDGAVARKLTPHVLELPEADHGLFLPGPLELSAQNIGRLASASEQFLDEAVWPTAR